MCRVIVFLIGCWACISINTTSGQVSADSAKFVRIGADVEGLTDLNAVFEDEEGRIWIGTRSAGLFMYDGFNFQNYTNQLKDSILLPFNDISRIYQLRNGHIIFTFRGGFGEIDLKTNHFARHLLQDTINTFLNKTFFTSYYETKDRIWFGITYGLASYSKINKTYHHYPILDIPPNTPDVRYIVYKIVKDPYANQLWLGTSYGLKLFDLTTKAYLPLKNINKWHSINPQWHYFVVWDIYLDDHYILWMAGMSSGGILKYDIMSKEWSEFLYQHDPSHPYKGNGVMSIVPIDKNKIYYTSDLGWGKLDIKKKKLILLEALELKKIGWIQQTLVGRNGCLWIAAYNALLKSKTPIVSPNSRSNTKPIFMGVKTKEGTSSFLNTQSLEFNAESSSSSIQIGIANPKPNEKWLYRWKLNKGNWSKPSPEREIPVEDLSYGHNTIEFAASLEGLAWRNGQILKAFYERPFYLHASFIRNVLAGIFLFSVIGYLLYRYNKFRKIKQEKEHYLQLVELEMKSLRYQMNPHFIFNSLSSINNFILKEQVENASEYLTKFSKLMRSVLQNSACNLVPLSEELDTIQLYLDLEKIRFHNRFNFEITIQIVSDSLTLLIPPSLLQPFIENSIWHGLMPKKGGGMLHLNVIEEDSMLTFIIEDNGIGRAMSRLKKQLKQGTKKSMSTNITKDRIYYINQMYNTNATLEIIDLITDKVACGTKVIIRLEKFLKPIGKVSNQVTKLS